MRKLDTNTIIFLMVADLLVTLVAFFTAVQARYWLPFGVQLSWDEVAQPWAMYGLVALIWGVTLRIVPTSRYSNELKVWLKDVDVLV